MKKVFLSMMIMGISTAFIGSADAALFKNQRRAIKRSISSTSTSVGENLDQFGKSTKAVAKEVGHEISAGAKKTGAMISKGAKKTKAYFAKRMENIKQALNKGGKPFDIIFNSETKFKQEIKQIQALLKKVDAAKNATDSAKTNSVIVNIVPLKLLTAELSIYFNMCAEFLDTYLAALTNLKNAKSSEGKAYAKAVNLFENARSTIHFAADLKEIIANTEIMVDRFEGLDIANAEDISKRLKKLSDSLQKLELSDGFTEPFDAINAAIINQDFADQNAATMESVNDIASFLGDVAGIIETYADGLTAEAKLDKLLENNDDTATIYSDAYSIDSVSTDDSDATF